MNNPIQQESRVQAALSTLADSSMESRTENVISKSPIRFPLPRGWNSALPYWLIALVLGMIQVWANRFYMGNDGVSYLDMADAYLRGDWHVALNTSWNPLYAWLICLDFLAFRPSPRWEFSTIQLLNYGIYVVAVASFEYFLRGWLQWKRGDETALRVIAYGLFLWSSLILIGTWTVNADMLVSACIYAALGMILRAHISKSVSARTSVLLGLTLAAGYYSKAIMFPLALILLLIAWIVFRWQRALITIFVFGMISAPLILGISKVAGHPTFGDTGRVNYSWYVDGVAQRWWQGGPDKAGMPLHPPLKVLDSPRVYEFDSVFPKATYPIWYDFAYWYQGVRLWIPLRRQAKVIENNIVWILELLVLQGGASCWDGQFPFLPPRIRRKFSRASALHGLPGWRVLPHCCSIVRCMLRRDI